jgi:organic hydroperoxide reductase OsmC/OhrA
VATYTAEVVWERGGQNFVDRRYSRRHRLRFDGGAEVVGSSSPHTVPLPLSDAAGVDPEEAFVAALASCHMLWFLGLAAAQGFCVDRYIDEASGTLGRDAEGRMAMTEVVLRPSTSFSGARTPSSAELVALHHRAHAECFIANSVRTEVRCEPRLER